MGKKIISMMDLRNELVTVAKVSSTVLGARGSVIWLTQNEDDLKAIAKFNEKDSSELQSVIPLLEEAAAWSVSEAAPLLVRNSSEDERFSGWERTGFSFLVVPLVSKNRTIGAIAVYGKERRNIFDSPTFNRNDEQFLAILADETSVAVENARLFDEVRRSEARLRETQALLLHSEKLAALGEMSAKVAHEIRNPLASIGGFARRAAKSMGDQDPNREYLQVIVRETDRLERILTEQLQFAQLSRPTLKLENMNAIIQETLQLISDDIGKKKARLLKKFSLDLPKLLLDADKMKQVFLNIFQNALEFMPKGGRLRIESSLTETDVLVEIANDGPKIPGEMLDRIFVPFATSKKHGSGLGLAVAYQIVREHGGEINARSEGDWSAIFTVSIPVKGNQDRRTTPDRRSGNSDRRGRMKWMNPG
jgi:signal transduction histidine kinase